MSVAVEAQLCVGCGMCCDGTIFSHADIASDEFVQPSVEKHLRVVSESRQLPQRCAILDDDACCTEYQDRPSPCRAFSCALLSAVNADELSVDSAKALIESTLVLRDSARHFAMAAVGEHQAEPIDALVRRLDRAEKDSTDPGQFRRENAQVYMSLAALRMAIGSHFHTFATSQWVQTGMDDSESK